MGAHVRRGRSQPLIELLTRTALAAGLAFTALAPASAAEGDADLAFNIGRPSTQVAAGWLGVNPCTSYNPRRGNGLTTAPSTAGLPRPRRRRPHCARHHDREQPGGRRRRAERRLRGHDLHGGSHRQQRHEVLLRLTVAAM